MQLLVIAMCNCCDYWAAVWGKDTSFTQLAHHRTPLVTSSLQGWTEGGPATTPCPSLSPGPGWTFGKGTELPSLELLLGILVLSWAAVGTEMVSA